MRAANRNATLAFDPCAQRAFVRFWREARVARVERRTRVSARRDLGRALQIDARRTEVVLVEMFLVEMSLELRAREIGVRCIRFIGAAGTDRRGLRDRSARVEREPGADHQPREARDRDRERRRKPCRLLLHASRVSALAPPPTRRDPARWRAPRMCALTE